MTITLHPEDVIMDSLLYELITHLVLNNIKIDIKYKGIVDKFYERIILFQKLVQ